MFMRVHRTVMWLREVVNVIEKFLADHGPWTWLMSLAWSVLGIPVYCVLLFDEIFFPGHRP